MRRGHPDRDRGGSAALHAEFRRHILRFVLLQHQPHPFDVVAREPPTPFRIQVAQFEHIQIAMSYPCQRPEWVIFYRTRTSKSHLRKTLKLASRSALEKYSSADESRKSVFASS
jgi:hypothetical protein